MAECRFKFPLLNGGRRAGLNDAGIETFKSNPLGALARECAQNSLDAGISKDCPARLVFKFHEFAVKAIPGLADLKDAFESCKKFWPAGSPEYKFSDRALAYFEREKISVLEISDYNTTGLPGEDDETGSPWDALVMSAGQCNKDSNAGGGFGIGKSAPFAVSAWRTVFYSSLTPEGKYAFRGVCYNMTHFDSEDKKTQGIGYYGIISDDETNIISLRDPAQIPDSFRRNEPGTSIFVIAVDNDKDSHAKLKQATLENFWPAIYFEKICFDVDGDEIRKDNLAEHMAQNGELSPFMQCLENDRRIYVTEDVGRLGKCELYFLLTDEPRKREIVCTRVSRMKIQSIDNRWGMDGIGFVGLFSCLSDEGQKILKNMEPPEHCKWDYKRSNDDDSPLTEAERQRITTGLKRWIKDKISEQIKKDYTEETDLEDAGRYFNDESAEGSGDDNGNGENHDAFTSTVKRIKVTKVLAGKKKRHTDIILTDAGDASEDDGVAAPNPDGGSGGGGKGIVRGGEEGGTKGDKAAGNAPRVRFTPRVVISGGEYALMLKPQKAFKGELSLFASGEDNAEPLDILEARTDDQELPVINGRIAKISMDQDAIYKIYVKTRDEEYFAVEVIGYESDR